jgi:hypothetical protein
MARRTLTIEFHIAASSSDPKCNRRSAPLCRLQSGVRMRGLTRYNEISCSVPLAALP